MGYPNLGFSQLATLYYKVPVSATFAGSSVNPTSLPVQFAFMVQATQVPQVTDWVTGSWETVAGNLLFPYSARCLPARSRCRSRSPRSRTRSRSGTGRARETPGWNWSMTRKQRG